MSCVVGVMGGPQVVPRIGHGIADLERAIAHGLPVAVARNVATSVAPFDSGMRQRVADLIASPATLKRRDTLSPEAGQRAERLARVTAMAHRALGSVAEAQDWLTAKHMLFGQRPIEVAATDLGARRVERVLNNIEYDLPV